MIYDCLLSGILDDVSPLARLNHLGNEGLYRGCPLLDIADKQGIRIRIEPYLLHLPHLVEEHILILRCGRHDIIHRQLAQHTSLNLYLLDIVFPLNLGTSLQLFGVIDTHLREEFDARLVEIAVENKRCRSFAIETSALRLLAPLLRVAVAIEAYRLALPNQLSQTLIYRLILLLSLGNACIDLFAEVDKGLRNSRIEDYHRIGAVVR